MPILQDEDAVAAYKPPVSSCDMCDRKLKSACVREVRVELTLTEEGGGGMAPDIVMTSEDGKSMMFCSKACARDAAKMVASEVQNPVRRNVEGAADPQGEYTFPGHVPFRGKIDKWDIHFTTIGPASWDEGQPSRGGI